MNRNTVALLTILMLGSILSTTTELMAQQRTNGALPTAGNPPTIDQNGVLTFPASYPRWYSLGNGPLSLTMANPYPQIAFDRSPLGAMPHGEMAYNKSYNRRALAPNIELGVLIAKIGENGNAFMPFQQRWKYGSSELNTEYRFDTTVEVFIAINDFNYNDNRGAYRFTITDRGSNSTVQLIKTEPCYREQCEMWLVTFARSDGWFDTGIRINATQKVKVFGPDESLSIRVGAFTDETIKMGGKSFAFASQNYLNEWRGQIGSNYNLVDLNWSDTLKLKINDSYPHSILREVKVMVGPTRGM